MPRALNEIVLPQFLILAMIAQVAMCELCSHHSFDKQYALYMLIVSAAALGVGIISIILSIVKKSFSFLHMLLVFGIAGQLAASMLAYLKHVESTGTGIADVVKQLEYEKTMSITVRLTSWGVAVGVLWLVYSGRAMQLYRK